jgi:hypothetical protein
VTNPASLTANEFDTRIQWLMNSLGERLISAHRDLLREALRRVGEREGLVEALLDRGLQWDAQLGRNRLLEEVAEAALDYRRATEERQDKREAGRRPYVALGRLHRAPNPGRRWLAPEAVTLVREALQGVLDGLARWPPVVGTLAAGRVRDALALLPTEVQERGRPPTP